MNFFHRVVLKIHNSYLHWIDTIYINACKNRGLKIGKKTIFINAPDFGSEPYLITIGENNLLTTGIRFITHDGGLFTLNQLEEYKTIRNFGRIKIGNNCFVGNNCIFLPNSQMGNNCVLGAGSVLNTSMPDNSVFAGVPAKFICTLSEYGEKALLKNTVYPRELEINRKKLDDYLSKNLSYIYKKTQKRNNDEQKN